MLATMELPAGRHLEDTLDARADSELRERFIRMAERELDRAYRLAGVILGSAPEAEDAVGDALERAWRSLAELRDTERFQAWFERIVVNACRDVVRRRGRVRFVGLEAGDAPRTADPFRTVLESDAAYRLIRVLGADEREVVILHFWADLTLEAVAERLDLPVGTVKSRLHRALVRMRGETAG